jgi:protein-tyrosine phosphatase/arsenate reductase
LDFFSFPFLTLGYKNTAQMLHKEINHLCSSILKDIRTKISPDRRSILEAIAKQIDSELKIGNTIKLVYLCTHNSRRSHFSQVWGHVASLFFGFSEIETYSGGTVATACHPNTIEALRELGFTITCEELSSENPNYNVFYAENDFIHCYSKANTDNVLPQSDFIAIMTCSDSDDNCPLVPGAKKRFSTTYDDPKEFDDSANPIEHYKERSLQIAHEALYTFQYLSKIRAKK